MMYGHQMGAGAWIIMGFAVLAVLVSIAIGVVLLIRSAASTPVGRPPGNTDALDLLNAGLARGEVSEDDYRTRRALIVDRP